MAESTLSSSPVAILAAATNSDSTGWFHDRIEVNAVAHVLTDRGGITISPGVSWSSGGEFQQRHQCMQQERSMAVGTATLGDSQRCRCGCLCVHPDCLSGLGFVRVAVSCTYLHILVASHDADDSTEMT